jgi:hypothetical protein
MKNLRIVLVIVLSFTGITQSQAQFLNTLKTSPWVIGVGWNIVDDNGEPGSVFATSEEWNLKAYPSSFRVEKEYKDGLSFVLTGSYNDYDGSKNTEVSSTFLAFDLGVKYNFMQLYNINDKWFKFSDNVFDIYTALSFGVTERSKDIVGTSPTVNLGFGMNAFIYNGWGINLDVQGKLGLTGGFISTPANYSQYSFGVIKRIGSK